MQPSNDFRPIPLLKPFAVFALAVLIAASGLLALLIQRDFETNLLRVNENQNVALARVLSNQVWRRYQRTLIRSPEKRGTIAADEPVIDEIAESIAAHTRGTQIIKFKIYDATGMTLFSTERAQIGVWKPDSVEIARAREGEVVTRFSERDRFYAEGEFLVDVSIVSSYLPVRNDHGQVEAVFELYSDVSRQVQDARTNLVRIILGVAIIFLVTYVLLFLLVRYAQLVIHRQQREIHQRATHDYLTGLPNRPLLMDRLVQAIHAADRHNKQVALLYLDLNKFKSINDSMGHHAGDRLLVAMAHRLSEVIRKSDTVARIGGDEFTIVVSPFDDIAEVQTLISRITQQLATPVRIDNEEVPLSASIGVAVYPDDGQSPEDMMRRADSAMYQAKANGDPNYRFFSDTLDQSIQDRTVRVVELEQALENDEFVLYFQPKVDASSGTILGSEALLRWQHPHRGLVSPLDFIPLLEETGLIVQVGEWVIREACRLNQSWQLKGLPAVPVAVNVAAQQFSSKDFVDSLEQAIQESGMAARYLEIEVTESCLMEDVRTNIAVLQAIRDREISIAVDDFGTGYSSLSYLQRFPITTLKIDRSFIANVHNRKDNDNAAIVTAIMALSHSLRLNVVAEGVEDAQELAYLFALGCKTIQGFLFSRPLNAAEFEKLLADSLSLEKTMQTIRDTLAIRSA